MSRSDRLIPLLSTLVALALGGCATTYPMMPTPVLYTGPQAKPLFTDLSAERRTPPLDLLYITDRAPATSPDDAGPYTANRSRSLAFGSTIIKFGENVTWDALDKRSSQSHRDDDIYLELGTTKEIGRFPHIPYEVAVGSNGISRVPAFIDAHEKSKLGLQAEVARRLDASPRKEVVLYVHGYHNTFEDAALTMGELCHFLGREFVCGIFTWPAGGRRGILFGYNIDRESGEYAVEDLLKTIRIIATTRGVKKLHLIAHSRGADILASAISELSVEAYIRGRALAKQYNIGNVMLLAPDIDADVAMSKINKVFSDPDLPFGATPNPQIVIEPTPQFNVTLYVSPDDKALATSGWLFGSIARLGRIDTTMLSASEIEQMRALGSVQVIQVRGATDMFGHSYIVSNPQVSADIIATLRYGLKPNEPGRPLEEIVGPFWRLRTDDCARSAR